MLKLNFPKSFSIKTFLFLSLNLILFLNLSCTTDLILEPDLKLELKDVSCTEAWMQLTTNNIQLPATINLLKNNTVAQVFDLRTKDSLLYIDSLLPNQNYKFKAVLNNSAQPTTNEVLAQTMDTTSHNFTWQTFTWGNSGSSTLNDVAIISENDIWAVGEIHIADSSVNGFTRYNAVHWNGTTWELKKILFYTICGQTHKDAYEISSILAFNANEIWMSLSGDQTAKIENGIQTKTVCIPYSFSIKKMWGTSSNNLYAVGFTGNIVHYNGSNWTRIESGTTLNINDIWGDYNQKTDKWEILAACGNFLQGNENERGIIRIVNKDATTFINPTGTKWPLIGVWLKAGKKYYVNGAGIYRVNKLGNDWNGTPLEITEFTTRRIRGNDINDIIACGDLGDLLHFNGNNWQSYISQTYLQNGTLLSVDIKNNLVVAAGWKSQQAALIVGNR